MEEEMISNKQLLLEIINKTILTVNDNNCQNEQISQLIKLGPEIVPEIDDAIQYVIQHGDHIWAFKNAGLLCETIGKIGGDKAYGILTSLVTQESDIYEYNYIREGAIQGLSHLKDQRGSAVAEPQNTIIVEAYSLEEAINQARCQTPKGLRLTSKKIISEGGTKTVKTSGVTLEEAQIKIQTIIPPEAKILESKETAPQQQPWDIPHEAFDEQGAKAEAELYMRESPNKLTIQRIELKTQGTKGFLGIGKKPNQYKIIFLKHLPASVETVYQLKAKVSFDLGPEDRRKFTSSRTTSLPKIPESDSYQLTEYLKENFAHHNPKSYNYFLTPRELCDIAEFYSDDIAVRWSDQARWISAVSDFYVSMEWKAHPTINGIALVGLWEFKTSLDAKNIWFQKDVLIKGLPIESLLGIRGRFALNFQGGGFSLGRDKTILIQNDELWERICDHCLLIGAPLE